MTPLHNLIPASRLQARRTSAAIRTWAGINCAGVAVLAAVWGILAGTRDSGAQAIEHQLNQVGASVDDAQGALKRASVELANLTRQIASAPDIRERPEWGVLLSTLGSVRGDSVAMMTLDLAPYESGPAGAKKPGASLPSRYQLHLTGVAKDHRSATGFSLAVERTGLFSQVRLTDATARSSENGVVVAFSIDCVLDDSSGGSP